MYDIILVLKSWSSLSQSDKNDMMKEFLFDRDAAISSDDFETFLAKKFNLFDITISPNIL